MPTFKYRYSSLAILLAVVLGAGILFWSDPSAQNTSIAEQDPTQPVAKRITEIDTTLPLPKAWTGDLDGILERRFIRILVPYSLTLYFHDHGMEKGIVHDAGMELEKWLNRKYGKKNMPIHVVFIPAPREFLLDNLNDGIGDIVAANLTITPERQKVVDFTIPMPKPVNEIVVTGPAAPPLETLEDLAKVPIYVRKTSSYHEHLVKLNKEQKLGLTIRPADELLEDEGILEMVNAGMIPLAIVDSHKAEFWSHVFKNLTLRDDLLINRGGRIAWAIRKNSPKLLAELNSFRKTKEKQLGLSNMLLKRYLGTTKYVENALREEEIKKYVQLKSTFQKYADEFDLDTLLLMAQGYQESRLNQNTRSHVGAVGIMQLLPKTAANPPIEISGIETDPERNIHAGAKYMRYLMDTYLTEAEIDETNRLLLGLAAYNAGPGNLRKMQEKAIKMKLKPHIWFNNVEHAAAVTIGRETVQYVSNIYKYYLAYRLAEEQQLLSQERTEAWKK